MARGVWWFVHARCVSKTITAVSCTAALTRANIPNVGCGVENGCSNCFSDVACGTQSDKCVWQSYNACTPRCGATADTCGYCNGEESCAAPCQWVPEWTACRDPCDPAECGTCLSEDSCAATAGSCQWYQGVWGGVCVPG